MDLSVLPAGEFLFATGILHLLYTESLLRGYRAGDYSVVYPLARGTGPLLPSRAHAYFWVNILPWAWRRWR